jgi:hypothetical protein
VIILGNVKILGICTIIAIVVSFEQLVTIAYHGKNCISYLEIRISDEIWDKEVRKKVQEVCEAEIRIRRGGLLQNARCGTSHL